MLTKLYLLVIWDYSSSYCPIWPWLANRRWPLDYLNSNIWISVVCCLFIFAVYFAVPFFPHFSYILLHCTSRIYLKKRWSMRSFFSSLLSFSFHSPSLISSHSFCFSLLISTLICFRLPTHHPLPSPCWFWLFSLKLQMLYCNELVVFSCYIILFT